MKNNLTKFIGSFLIANAILLQVQAQNAHEISTTINKATKTAFLAEYQANKDLMETTLDEKMKKAGLPKGKSSKGFVKYEAVVLTEISPNKIDIYTKIDGKKDASTVTMMVSTGYDNFISTATDATLAANTIAFLNRLADDAVTTKKLIDISAQEKAVKEAEDQLKKTENEKEKLGKKIAEMQKELESASQNQDKAAKQLEAEKVRLDNLKNQNAVIEIKN